MSFEEFHDWRVCSWELPSSVSYILRVQRKDTGKVKEFIYKQPKAAANKVEKLMEDPLNEITICDEDQIQFVSYNNELVDALLEDDDDSDDD